MANAFTTHHIAANDQALLIGAAGRNSNDDMDTILNTNYAGLQALERIAVKNYAAQQARAQGMLFFSFIICFSFLFLSQMKNNRIKILKIATFYFLVFFCLFLFSLSRLFCRLQLIGCY